MPRFLSANNLGAALGVALSLFAPSVACAQDGAPVVVNRNITLSEAKLHIPMDHSSGHIAISTKVNGQGPYRFQLDTGAGPQACIDEKLAQQLKLPKVGEVPNSAGDPENAVLRDMVRVDMLEFGGAEFSSVTALVADYSWISNDKDNPVMGLLGFALFRDLLLTIDYPEDEIVLQQGALEADDEELHRFIVETGVPFIGIKIGDAEFRTLIDTGAKGSIVLTEDMLDKLKIDGEPQVAGMARTVNETFPIYRATLSDDLTLAGRSFPKVEATIFKQYRYSILGHRLLAEFAITFDQRTRRVRFVPKDDDA